MVRSKVVIQRIVSSDGKSVGIKGMASAATGTDSPTVQQTITLNVSSNRQGDRSYSSMYYYSSIQQNTEH